MAIQDLFFIDAQGFHTADYPAVLQYFQDAYRSIYGSDVYLEPDSQDGQLLAIFAVAVYDTMNIAAKVYNSFSPLTAQSDALSRNVKINGIRRRVATYSTVDLLITGQAGTVITNGQAQDINGTTWLLPVQLVIPPTGQITVTAVAEKPGDVEALPNTITRIKTPTLGWQSVTNPSSAAVGQPVETDAELRRRQTYSTALPSRSVLDGTIGAVGAVAGVTRFRGYENDTDTTDANGIPPHSIAIVAEGGAAEDIAQAIVIKKTPGTGTYGTTSVTVYDELGLPNTINFFRPTVATIGVEITITALPGYTATYAELIAEAVAASIAQLDIGDDILVTKLYVPANLPGTPEGSTFYITNLRVNKNGGAYTTSNIELSFIEIAVTDPATDVAIIVT